MSTFSPYVNKRNTITIYRPPQDAIVINEYVTTMARDSMVYIYANSLEEAASSTGSNGRGPRVYTTPNALGQIETIYGLSTSGLPSNQYQWTFVRAGEQLRIDYTTGDAGGGTWFRIHIDIWEIV